MAGAVTFTPTREDYVAAVRINFRAAIRRPRAIRVWAIAIIVMAGFGAVLLYMNDVLFQFIPAHALSDEALTDLRKTLRESPVPWF